MKTIGFVCKDTKKNVCIRRYYHKKDKSRDVDIANRLYSKNSKEVNKKIANMSTGEAVARSFLFSSYGALKWEQAKGAGYGTGKTFVTTWAKTGINSMLGGIPGMLEYFDNVDARK